MLPNVFTIVAGFCHENRLKLKKTPRNLLYYQQIILEHIFEKEIKAVYEKGTNRVDIYKAKDSSHISCQLPHI